MGSEVKAYPQLNTAVLNRKLDREYSVWLAMRYLSNDGRVTLKDLEALGIFSKPTLSRALKDGQGIFFGDVYTSKEGVRTCLFLGLGAVARALGVRGISEPQRIPLDELSSVRRRRAVFYASSLQNRKPKPISRIAQETKYNRSKSTLRRYEKTSGVKGKPGRAVANKHNDGSAVLVDFKQLPNEYKSPFKTAPLGMVRKVNRALKSLDSVVRDENRERLYFQSIKDYTNTMKGLNSRIGTHAFIRLPQDKRLIRGRSEWLFVFQN